MRCATVILRIACRHVDQPYTYSSQILVLFGLTNYTSHCNRLFLTNNINHLSLVLIKSCDCKWPAVCLFLCLSVCFKVQLLVNYLYHLTQQVWSSQLSDTENAMVSHVRMNNQRAMTKYKKMTKVHLVVSNNVFKFVPL